MTTPFRVGLSPTLDPSRGKLKFPSYDLAELAADPAFDLAYYEADEPLSAKALAGFDGVVLLGERMAAESFPGDGRLKLIARMGVGFDTVDVPACTAHHVALTITPPAVARPMAVATLNYLLALANNMMVKDRLTRQGPDGWAARTDHHGIGLIGRTFAMIGLGNIGRETLKLIRPLDMRVIVCDPALTAGDAEALGVVPVDLETAFREGDFVSLHCPLNDQTRHLVNAERLALMKPTAYLINTARGPVVDQIALYDALSSGRIAGAGLDVMDPEPSAADEPIARLNNVVLAPHALGWTDQMFAEMARVNAAAIRAVAEGKAPEFVVNKEVLSAPDFLAKLTR
ncbi:MAG: dehydrogenase [Alphaproteobacteria bacterium]|nr:dehydrogenase [Alphaproteobacteria bacterium]